MLVQIARLLRVLAFLLDQPPFPIILLHNIVTKAHYGYFELN